MQHRELGSQGPKDRLATGRRRAPAEIEHDRAPIQAPPQHAGHQGPLVVGQQLLAIVHDPITAEATGGPHTLEPGLNRLLLAATQLGTGGAKHLDAVVVGGVVTGRNHQPAGSPQATDRPWDCRRGANTQGPHFPAGGGEARRECGHQHRTAAAGIHPNQHRAGWRQHLAAPKTHLHGQGRTQLGADAAPDAIGAETGNATPQGMANGMGSQLGHKRMPQGGSGYVDQRQRRGHQIQRTSSPRAQSSSSPTSQPGSKFSGHQGLSSSTKPTPASTRSARSRWGAPGRLER